MTEPMSITQLRDTHDMLPAYAWPGGYPIFYLDAESNALCAPCASDRSYPYPTVAHDVHWEGPPLLCDHCGSSIESAYGDPEGDDDAE